jgi:hypothetical protein
MNVRMRQRLLGMALLTPLLMMAQPHPLQSPFFAIGELLYQDDFSQGLANWAAELEMPGRIEAKDGRLIIEVPAGLTLWFRPQLDGPILIQYDATMVRAGGTNDRVSDLNCFWMATDSRSPDRFFATKRSGKFSDYDPPGVLCRTGRKFRLRSPHPVLSEWQPDLRLSGPGAVYAGSFRVPDRDQSHGNQQFSRSPSSEKINAPAIPCAGLPSSIIGYRNTAGRNVGAGLCACPRAATQGMASSLAAVFPESDLRRRQSCHPADSACAPSLESRTPPGG